MKKKEIGPRGFANEVHCKFNRVVKGIQGLVLEGYYHMFMYLFYFDKLVLFNRRRKLRKHPSDKYNCLPHLIPITLRLLTTAFYLDHMSRCHDFHCLRNLFPIKRRLIRRKWAIMSLP